MLPAPPGRRKVALATSIAETSLTIEGVRIVIDSGLARAPLRAGYRRDEARNAARVTGRRRPAARPRRPHRAGTLLPAVGGGGQWGAGALRQAGNSRGRSFRLSPGSRRLGRRRPRRARFPRRAAGAALKEARALLTVIGALGADGRVTEEGTAIARLALPPRLARMLIAAAREGDAETAAASRFS